MSVTQLPSARRNDTTARLQLETSRVAVELQTIANRFAHMRMTAVAEHVNAAADAAAKAAFVMGAVRYIDQGAFVASFPHLWRVCGYAGDEDDDDR